MPETSTLFRRLLLWTLICCASAAPSYMFAANEFNRPAMAVGVALFILAYTALTSTAAFERFHNRPFVRTTLYTGYSLRLLLSGCFPLGMGADVLPGMLSVSAVQAIGLNPHGFKGTLLTTIVQGTLLNILLMLFMALVYAAQKLFLTPPPPAEPKGFEVVVPALPVLQATPQALAVADAVSRPATHI